MHQLILQTVTLPILVTSLMGILLHETQLDNAITKVVANNNNIVIKAEIGQRPHHTHSHQDSILEHLRAFNASRNNAKRNRGENERKYLIKKRTSSRSMSNDGMFWPSE